MLDTAEKCSQLVLRAMQNLYAQIRADEQLISYDYVDKLSSIADILVIRNELNPMYRTAHTRFIETLYKSIVYYTGHYNDPEIKKTAGSTEVRDMFLNKFDFYITALKESKLNMNYNENIFSVHQRLKDLLTKELQT